MESNRKGGGSNRLGHSKPSGTVSGNGSTRLGIDFGNVSAQELAGEQEESEELEAAYTNVFREVTTAAQPLAEAGQAVRFDEERWTIEDRAETDVEADASSDGGEQSPQPSDFIASRGPVIATRPTNPEGYFYIEPLEADVHGELTLFVPDTENATDVLRVRLPRPYGALPDLVLHRPLLLEGTVVDQEGSPVEGAFVIPQFTAGHRARAPSDR